MKTIFATAAIITVFAANALSAESGLFDSPLQLFKDALIPALTNSERAKVQTTWRGFYLRADTQRRFELEHEPSVAGIYLDASVRDSVEIPAFSDTTTKAKGIITRTVKFPAPDKVQGLVITLVYGSDANSDAVAALNRSIAEIQRKAEQTTETD